jgi:hypothetical protein
MGMSREEKYRLRASAARSEGFRLSFLAVRSTRLPNVAGSLIVYERLFIMRPAYHLPERGQDEGAVRFFNPYFG